ncbi:oxygen-dependent coproporphyrinogen oxidase [Phaeocystidibacter marisrubri]|uniref:coproporphyrinogen oxidase n=1 Tax=Phaeocystidibacter marisrubri TaxID=1577780 RepID=A0A6L3ZCR0_9FLAO|nr:oxygen-dependent coproporphyrinogen oxidase [Phaeocystidibacter marisrubri]KAB2815241.1 oxygen-dependent coproporphyrinogen oxidase [Phaeocystidibacter marisrubri]GGH71065.1 coproporphyrinogen oxidase [Phaeocystidibacter marisrubri]
MKERFAQLVRDIQDEICNALENLDGGAKFEEDLWERPGGGGGRTRVIRDGKVFEKGGVNTSEVYGELPEIMQKRLGVEGAEFYATGVSLVIHPVNPMVPTVHLNYRYFEMYNEDGSVKDAWFGGGADLTPYYLFEDDCVHFHQMHKDACDSIDANFYPRFKQQCDDYFVNTHRNENRGIGGIFYDYMRVDEKHSAEDYYSLASACGKAFLNAYLPIVEKRMELPYSEENTFWQEIRRGRYVEFNLVHDRGTTFGLKTNGRTESILMSLPARARWEYDYHPKPGTPEAEMVAALQPRNWLNL